VSPREKQIAEKKKAKIETMHVHERGVGTPKCPLGQLTQVGEVHSFRYHGLLQEYLADEGEKKTVKQFPLPQASPRVSR
jgi:hypothetical protein